MTDLAALAEIRRHPERYRGETGPRGERGPTGPRGPQGEPGLRWRGEWQAGTRYQPGDVVEHAGSAYVHVAPRSEQRPPAGWGLLAQKGDSGSPSYAFGGGGRGPAGDTGATGPAGDTGATGPAGADAPSTLDVHLMGWDGGTWIPVLGDATGRLMVTS